MHSPKWTPPLWLLMLQLASSTTGWMSRVSSRLMVWNNLLRRTRLAYSLTARRRRNARLPSTDSKNVLRPQLQRSTCIKCDHRCSQCVTAVLHIQKVSACLWPLPSQSRALLARSQQQQGGHCGERSQPMFAVCFSLAARLAPALFIFSRDV